MGPYYFSSPPTFLLSVLGGLKSDSPHRPYVTLTFAQSLDAKIAGEGGKQLALSGPKSMEMTHWYENFLIQAVAFSLKRERPKDAIAARCHFGWHWDRARR